MIAVAMAFKIVDLPTPLSPRRIFQFFSLGKSIYSFSKGPMSSRIKRRSPGVGVGAGTGGVPGMAAKGSVALDNDPRIVSSAAKFSVMENGITWTLNRR